MSRLAVAVALVLLGVVPAEAHTTSTGLARITVDGGTIVYRLALVLGELPDAPRQLLTAAADGDAAAAERAAEELRRRVTIGDGVQPCRPGRAVIQGSRLRDGRLTLELWLSCAVPPARLEVVDDWAELLGEHHRTLARVERDGAVYEIAFSPELRRATVELGGRPRARGFFVLGVEHILTGYDHMLFLVALLLGGGRLLPLLKIVTAFTIAHSATLAVSVLGAATVPSYLVEAIIAASIVWVALENLVSRRAVSRRWVVAFAFGLVHGLGFAGALGALELPRAGLAAALALFNLGVEAGQMVVISALLPLLAWSRQRGWEPVVVRAASVVLVVLGLVWAVERLFA
jgi:hypothetical protein